MIKIQTVPTDALINIPVSGYFYKRLTGLYFTLVRKYSEEEFLKLSNAIANDKISTLDADDKIEATALQTLLIFMSSIETQFKEESMVIDEEVEPPEED